MLPLTNCYNDFYLCLRVSLFVRSDLFTIFHYKTAKLCLILEKVRGKVQNTYTVKPVLRGHLWDKEKMAL